VESKNLFSGIPVHLPEEFVEVLAEGTGIRIERIASRGHASPPDFWYDQKEAEWVLLLSGSARIRFEGESEPLTLTPGDYLDIPARARHRVEDTDPLADTVWLAVHYRK
jgi:cupin 2 domain-containing protein